MELNIDAIRAVLQFIKDNTVYEEGRRVGKQYFTQGDIIRSIPETSKYSSNDIGYSIELLLETDLIQLSEPVKYGPTGELYLVKIRKLTMEGYSFLEQTKNPTIWEAVKGRAKATCNFSLKTICGIAATLGTQMMADPNALNNFIEGTKNTLHMIGM